MKISLSQRIFTPRAIELDNLIARKFAEIPKVHKASDNVSVLSSISLSSGDTEDHIAHRHVSDNIYNFHVTKRG